MVGENGFQVRPFCLDLLIHFNFLQDYFEYLSGISMKDVLKTINSNHRHKVLLLPHIDDFNNSQGNVAMCYVMLGGETLKLSVIKATFPVLSLDRVEEVITLSSPSNSSDRIGSNERK